MSGLTKIGKFVPSTTSLFLCDMQVKFKPSIFNFDNVVSNCNRVLHAAQIMSIPTIATEQYPKGLGPTVPELEISKFNIVPHSKTCFTMMIPDVLKQINDGKTKSVILCGIETQACITATTLGKYDLKQIN